MATARLSDQEKCSIVNSVERTIKRALHNKVFPVPEDEISEWVTNQLPTRIREAYLLLREEDRGLVKKQGYGCDFIIHSDTHKYQIGVSKWVPKNGLVISPHDPYHASVLEWAAWNSETKDAVSAADDYISSLVWSCTSAGQLKRLLPVEIMRFIPDHLLDFSLVERRSRIPNSFNPDKKQLEAMMDLLVVGSLSPIERKGAFADLEHKVKIESKE